MNQLKIKNFAISTPIIRGRNLMSFYRQLYSSDASLSFNVTIYLFELVSDTPHNPLSRGDFKFINLIHESLLSRGGKEVCCND